MSSQIWLNSLCFNPRTRGECDVMVMVEPSTNTSCFNPRTRGECDTKDDVGGTLTVIVSIHALAGSATLPVFLQQPRPDQFQSTHSRGVRQYKPENLVPFTVVSIHALAGSATYLILYLYPVTKYSHGSANITFSRDIIIENPSLNCQRSIL